MPPHAAPQKTSQDLMSYWKPDLVRDAGQIALKLPHEQMNEVMILATEFMEQFAWRGLKRTYEQALAWPRMGAILEDGTLLLDDEVPEPIKECTIKVAYFIAAGVPFDVPALTHVILTIGPLLAPTADVTKNNLTPWGETVH